MIAAASDGRFRRQDRLRAKADFDRVFSRARRSKDRFFTVLFCENTDGQARLGLAISKRRVPAATGRNRLKRLIRESFRHSRSDLPDVDIVVLAGGAAGTAANSELFASLNAHWDRIRRAQRR